MRLTDDYYEEERDSSKLFLYMMLFMSVVVLGITGLVFWMNQEDKSGSNYQLAMQQAAERRQGSATVGAQTAEKSVDTLISGSTLTSDQLDIWDLSALTSADEIETPKSTKNGTVINQTTGETIVDGSSNSNSENSASNLAAGETSVYDKPQKQDEKEETEGETELIAADDQILIQHKDGSEELVEVNDELALNDYKASGFQYKKPIMSYMEDDKESSWCGAIISSDLGNVDFKKLKKAGCDYVMLKVGGRGYSSGELVLDEGFSEYASKAESAGLDIGVYFFSQAITKEEAEEEAETLLEIVKDYSISYPVMFRMHEIEGDMARVESLDLDSRTEIARTFLKKVKREGYIPMLYGDKEWLVNKIDLEELASYDVCLVQDAEKPDYPYEFDMWQYDNDATINGISEDVELSISFKDYAKE